MLVLCDLVCAAFVGLLMCAMPVGHIAGEVWAGSALGPRARERIVVPVAALVVTGLASAYPLGLDQWFVGAVPQELRGRAMTVMTAGMMTVQGVGMAVACVAAEFFPVHRVVAPGRGWWARCPCWHCRRRSGVPGPGCAENRKRPKRETGMFTI